MQQIPLNCGKDPDQDFNQELAVTPRQQPSDVPDESTEAGICVGPSKSAHIQLLECCVGSHTVQNARPYQV